MEFREQYLNYDEYKLLGGTLDMMPFNLLEIEARANIDRETMMRLKGKEIPTEVKACIFKIIEAMAFDGGYRDVNSTEKETYINKLIYNNLVGIVYDGIPLLYRGA